MLNAHTSYEVFEREHRALREGIESLRRALAENQSGSESELLEHVETVRAQLAVHFAFEEDFGFMHYLAVIQPALAPTLERLRAVHREILATLGRVFTRLQTGVPCADVRPTVHSTLEALAHHELDEHQLLRPALRGSELSARA
jgi:CII-binding regulator of phage lambda lysogenization HflD